MAGGKMDLFDNAEHVTIWDVIRHWMGRPMLTKLLKAHGKEAVKRAGLKTLEDEAVEQLPYLLSILQGGGNGELQVWQQSNEQLYAIAQERGIGTSGKTRQQLINELR
jgi:hypothetical protein